LAVVGYGAALLVVNNPPATAASDNANGALPSITILRSHGVQTQLNLRTARVITRDLLVDIQKKGDTRDSVRLRLEPGEGQGPPIAVAVLAGKTYRLAQTGGLHWSLQLKRAAPTVLANTPVLPGYRLTNV